MLCFPHHSPTLLQLCLACLPLGSVSRKMSFSPTTCFLVSFSSPEKKKKTRDEKQKAPTKQQIAEEAVAAALAQAQNPSEEAVMASLDAKRRKVVRPKSDPLMPKGGVEPNDWMELGKLQEGVRGILVSCVEPVSAPPRLFKRSMCEAGCAALAFFFPALFGSLSRGTVGIVCRMRAKVKRLFSPPTFPLFITFFCFGNSSSCLSSPLGSAVVDPFSITRGSGLFGGPTLMCSPPHVSKSFLYHNSPTPGQMPATTNPR